MAQPREAEPRRNIIRRHKLATGILAVGIVAAGIGTYALTRDGGSGPRNNTEPVAGQSTPTPSEATGSTPTPETVNWPGTPQEAANLFGVDEDGKNPDRWEINSAKGWHFIEGKKRSVINPHGLIFEGYFDTKEGSQQIVSNGVPVPVQGATIWPVSGEQQANNLLHKIPPAVWYDGTTHAPVAIGFTSNQNVGSNQ